MPDYGPHANAEIERLAGENAVLRADAHYAAAELDRANTTIAEMGRVIDSEQENGAMWADKFNIAEAERDAAEAALASTRRDLEAHMDAAKVREAALAESRGEVTRLRVNLEYIGRGKDNCAAYARHALEAPHEST